MSNDHKNLPSFLRSRSWRPGPLKRNRRRPRVEELEPYFLLSTFTVTSNTDNGSVSTVGTLSWAMDQVDNDSSDSEANPDVVAFNIGGGGAQTISVLADPEGFDEPVIVDGETQPGYSMTTHTPLIQIDGAAPNLSGLAFFGPSGTGASGSTIEGLDITDFTGFGIAIDATGVQVLASDVGITTAGMRRRPTEKAL